MPCDLHTSASISDALHVKPCMQRHRIRLKGSNAVEKRFQCVIKVNQEGKIKKDHKARQFSQLRTWNQLLFSIKQVISRDLLVWKIGGHLIILAHSKTTLFNSPAVFDPPPQERSII